MSADVKPEMEALFQIMLEQWVCRKAQTISFVSVLQLLRTMLSLLLLQLGHWLSRSETGAIPASAAVNVLLQNK